MSGVGERRQLVWLDLCSGLGGASQPALDRGWKVIRVDIDQRFKPDIVADVRALPLKPFHVDVLWASPPCKDFSKFGLRCFFPNPPDPDLSIVEAVHREMFRFYPTWWMVENTSPSRRWLTPMFGAVRAAAPGHVIWGKLPCLLPPTVSHKTDFVSRRYPAMGMKRDRVAVKGRHYDANGRLPDNELFDAATIAKIPYEIGEAICAAVERREAEAT